MSEKAGSGAQILDGRSSAAMAGKLSAVIRVTAVLEARRDDHTFSRPMPSGVTSPRPVTTTRRSSLTDCGGGREEEEEETVEAVENAQERDANG